MSDPQRPSTDFTQEYRFAVVMYGGISLAIYMNGIAQELLRLVRAAAPDPADRARARNAELSGSELIYRELACRLDRNRLLDHSDGTVRTRFVVDILAGTSAGGINAVYLAKALANDEPMDELQRLWVDEGDIARLINDARATESLNIRPSDPPRAPLSGDRMYLKLLGAFDDMGGHLPAQRGPNEKGRPSPNVDELDLFVTATDVRGLRTTLAVADAQPEERRYGAVFQLRYSAINAEGLAGPVLLGGPEGGPPPGPAQPPERNDFVAFNNPFLAFVARCTSAHQAAFQPMRLRDAVALLATVEGYRRLPWVVQGIVPPEWERLYPRAYTEPAQAGAGNPFFERDFADGGVLDNKPFSYVLDTIPRRSRVYPVTRKLLFVDPAPERFIGADAAERPGFVENGLAALLSIRGYEPIRQDLERLERYNQQTASLRRVEAEALLANDNQAAYPDETWEQIIAHHRTRAELRTSPLAALIHYYGIAWAAYVRLRALSTSTALGRLLARGAGIDDGSPRYRQLLAAVRAWADLHYAFDDPALGPTIIHFLLDFDIDWHLRRLGRALDDLDTVAEQRTGRAALLVDLARRYHRILTQMGELTPLLSPTQTFEEQRSALRATLGAVYSTLQAARGQLLNGDGRGAVAAAIKAADLPALLDGLRLDPRLGVEELQSQLAGLLREPAHPLRVALAGLILGSPGPPPVETPDASWARLDDLLAGRDGAGPSLQRAIGFMLAASRAEVNAALAIDEAFDRRPIVTAAADDGAPALVARFSVMEFERYDRILFPLTALSEVGDERAGVEVYRVSPYDARGLVDERRGASKLAGTSMGAFGAFFDERFRVNDIMWGRLDGAERIITALLPAPQQQAERERLVAAAQDAILLETYFAHTKEGREALPGCPTPELRREHFVRTFPARQVALRRLDNEALADNVARLGSVADRMFAAYGEAHPQASPLTLWANRLISLAVSVLDVALARDLRAVLLRRAIPLLYLIAALALLVGGFAGSAPVASFGLFLGGGVLAFQLLTILAADWIARGRAPWLRTLVVLLVVLFALALLVAAAVGGFVFGASGDAQATTWLLEQLRRPATLAWAIAALGLALVAIGALLARRGARLRSER
ncbi:MAG TPA: patatin-like protein [Chloroflexaceae bacterium]|nr:patatin-like protein [Chloroflexaceae bacterium]